MSLAFVGITLNIRNNRTYPIRINVLGSPVNLLDTANAKTEYRWDITAFTPSNDDILTLEYKRAGAGVFSTYTSQIYNTNTQSLITALDGLGIGYFQSYTELGQLYLSTYNDDTEFGLLTITNNGAPATSTTSTTTTAAPTSTTSTTTAAPTSTTTTSTTAAPTSTTTTTTAAPTSTTTTSTTAAPTSTTTTTTAAPTSTTTTSTTAAPTSTTTTTTAAPTSTTTTSTTAAPTTTTTTSTTAAPTSTTTTSTTAAVGGFTISNPSGSGQIDNVYTTGFASFYVINSGSFPVTTGGTVVAGLAVLTTEPMIVDISNYTLNSCLSLYINGIFNESITVTGTGTYTFNNKTFTTSDTVLLEYVSGAC